MTMRHDHLNDLPYDWSRPTPDCQRTLFRLQKAEALSELRVTENDICRWHARGWISFDVDAMQELDQPDQWEVEFVRGLALSGLADVQITQLLEGLDKPYSFDPSQIAYHFKYGWVRPCREDPFEVIEDNFTDWIEDLAEEEELSKLEELASLVVEQIESLTDRSEDGEEERAKGVPTRSSSHGSNLWNRLIEQCEQSLADALWVAAIREVAAQKLFGKKGLVTFGCEIRDEEKEERIEGLLNGWMWDAFPASTNLGFKIGEYDWFYNNCETWYEILGFAGEACTCSTSDIIYSLEMAYSKLKGEITSQEVEDFYQEWVARFLGIVLREAATVKR